MLIMLSLVWLPIPFVRTTTCL